MKHIKELQRAIRDLHGAKASHVETVPVKEVHQGQTVWEGDVEVFDLEDHPQAPRAYAWSHHIDDTSERKRYVAVLHIPPVTSPETAVKAAIVQEHRERLANE